MDFDEADVDCVFGADEPCPIDIFDLDKDWVSDVDEPCMADNVVLIEGVEAGNEIADKFDTGTSLGGLEGNNTWLPTGSDSIPNTCIGADAGVGANPGIGVKTGIGADVGIVANTDVVVNEGIRSKSGGVGEESDLGLPSFFFFSKWHT